ncbi:MAG TPA: ribulose-phosphate 3-epimerase [Chloroflexota bacterium]|jgi:ribulose-phosphate 3-epimerase|nr:ribulose-phosphate 3-epimerase [Chloroflexota bacterium]
MTEVNTVAARRIPRVIQIAPSILTVDFGRLDEQVRLAEEAGADRLHLDVMDGHFVPNITFGPLVVKAIRAATRLPLDVHLMIETPERYVEPFRDAGSDCLIVHLEATEHLHRLVEQIKALGALAGVALNPATPIIDLEDIAPFVESVLVMSVNPGFGGQSFIETSPRKIYRVRRLLDRWNPEASVGVDGGVDENTIQSVVASGADTIVAGSAVFNHRGTVQANLSRLRAAAAREPERSPEIPLPSSQVRLVAARASGQHGDTEVTETTESEI